MWGGAGLRGSAGFSKEEGGFYGVGGQHHSTDSHQKQQDNRLTFVKIGCANLRMLRSEFGRMPSPRSAVFTVPAATKKVLPLQLPLHRKRRDQVFHRQVRGILPVEDAHPLKIIYGEFSQNTARLTACRAGGMVAGSQKRRLNFLFAGRYAGFGPRNIL